MDYNFGQDLRFIREILGLTQTELARQIGVEQVTISRNELEKSNPTRNLLEKVYNFAFAKDINLGKLKEMLWQEELNKAHKLLFHGSKSEIEGKYNVNQEWMMTIAYYRGTLEQYKNHPIVVNLIEKSKKCDYIIAPIADNRMFQIINSFIAGEITDEQCKHCLAATNLGHQYVFKSGKSIEHVKLIERCYISDNEKEHYKNIRNSDTKLGDDKVKLARIHYRGKGQYIDEILKPR